MNKFYLAAGIALVTGCSGMNPGSMFGSSGGSDNSGGAGTSSSASSTGTLGGTSGLGSAGSSEAAAGSEAMVLRSAGRLGYGTGAIIPGDSDTTLFIGH